MYKRRSEKKQKVAMKHKSHIHNYHNESMRYPTGEMAEKHE